MVMEWKFSQLSMFIMLFVELIVRLFLIILNVFVCQAANFRKDFKKRGATCVSDLRCVDV